MPFHRTLRLGTCNTYLIPATKGFILVDAGNRRKGPLFLKHLAKMGVVPSQIGLVILTHVHFDHVGSCRFIQSACDANVMVHQVERPLLEEGIVVIPPGIPIVHAFASRLGNRYLKDRFRFPPCRVDYEITEKTSLSPFGVAGYVLPTPGHTRGSLSIVSKTGEAFVGDLMVNYRPFAYGGYLPPYGEDIPTILDSWERLLREGAKTFYPAHGWPIPASKLLAALQNHRNRHAHG